MTYAPPELSEPAMTKTRLTAMVGMAISELIDSGRLMEIIDSKSLSENDWVRHRMHGTKTREVPSANSTE